MLEVARSYVKSHTSGVEIDAASLPPTATSDSY